jgi:hypothetical protein
MSDIGEIVKQYLRENPTEKSKKLARKIFKERPELGTIESIRTRIRYYRLASGVKLRAKIATDEFADQSYKPKVETDEEIIREVIKSKKLTRG